MAAENNNATWKVLSREFSAITIGIAFEDDTTGWTSHTDGSSAINIVKTTDGGQTWASVKNNTGLHLLMMGVAANQKRELPITNVATTGLGASEWSVDGNDFKTSILLQAISQDIDYSPNGLTGQMTIAAPKAACVSVTGGAFYECKKIAFKNPGTGRYVASPSKDVLYVTAGTWPSKDNDDLEEDTFHVTRNLHVYMDPEEGTRKVKLGAWSDDPSDDTYTAELFKSTDGGANWTSLMYSEGEFYFNDIDCFDDTHCVAVGEGFPEDGSTKPGARIYMTSDGENFDLVVRSQYL